ncbi:Peptidyl-tRNA hydrolase [Hyphodiscus hymeniophilus]|uniref:peptidyl-tRNA hydrolase n=1 Tax=Hyphodiscus hymeniophilus TaxID=353542 RepID=A0A9P6VFG2_9HELO|nr:Peptidyl-tRNA hydrolase [Hyphodiscus hymeniophilus]
MTHDPEAVQPEKALPSQSPKPTRKQKRQQKLSEDADFSAIEILESSTLTLSIVPSMASPTRLLVCSIGNPAPLTNTLHSAGHLVLSTLASTFSYPAFQKSRAHGNGLLSSSPEFTLWQSSSFMNISGVGVVAAWKQFVKDNQRDGGDVGLVVVHDELELKVGDVRVKRGAASAKGHNGLKSINEKLRGADYTRIAVGIGRPESREPNAVADYVLRKMSVGDRGKIVGCVGRVEEELRKLAGTR